ncbi:MAG: CBS domain-containing protein [Candidatus Saccharimonadales bacterium]
MTGQPIWLWYGALLAAIMLLVVNSIVVDRRLAYTRMSGLLRLCDSLLLGIMITALIIYYGWGVGLLLASALGAARLVIGRLSMLRRGVQRLYRRYEASIMRATRDWHWLEWFGHRERDDALAISSQTELRDIVTRSRLLSAREQRQFDALFEKPKTIRDVMVSAEQIVTIGIDEPIGPLVLDELHSSGYRQFPVIDGDIDHIRGIVYLDDIVDLRSAKSSVQDALDPRLEYATPDEPVAQVLARCLDSRRMVVIVRDTYKKTIGMTLLRDLIQ